MIVKGMSRIRCDYLQVGFYTEVLFREKGVHSIAISNGVDSEKRESAEFAPAQEPIVDAETWNMALELRKKVRRPDILGEANPLTGKMFYADCGAKMITTAPTTT